MARYFFHLHDGKDYPDHTGVELPDIDAAKKHAAAFVGELLKDSSEAIWSGEDWVLKVSREDGLTLFCIHIVTIDSPAAPAPTVRT